MNEQIENSNKYDTAWKVVIEQLFQDFVKFFLSEIYDLIDFEKEYIFLDKELHSLYSEGIEKRIDKLVKVFFKDGKETWILIHIEVQGYQDKHFSERMFTYFYRLRDKYHKDIIAIAIFTDGNKMYRPNKYIYKYYKTKASYEYETYKVLDQKAEDLERNSNIFSLVVLSVLKMVKKRKNFDKIRTKKELMRILLTVGYGNEEIRIVLSFIDTIIRISYEENQGIINELQTEGEIPMDKYELMNSFEEHGYNIGHKKGIATGIATGITTGIFETTISNVKKMYKKNFNANSIAEILELDIAYVQKIISEPQLN